MAAWQTGLEPRSATATVHANRRQCKHDPKHLRQRQHLHANRRLRELCSKPVRRRQHSHDSGRLFRLGHQFLGQRQHHHVDRRVLQWGEEHCRQRQYTVRRWPRQQPEPRHSTSSAEPIQSQRAPVRSHLPVPSLGTGHSLQPSRRRAPASRSTATPSVGRPRRAAKAVPFPARRETSPGPASTSRPASTRRPTSAALPRAGQ